jgi:hypothetical protein
VVSYGGFKVNHVRYSSIHKNQTYGIGFAANQCFSPLLWKFCWETKTEKEPLSHCFQFTLRIMPSIRHLKILTMHAARPEYRCWIIGAQSFNPLGFTG